MHPEGGPEASDRKLAEFMGANTKETARHWRKRYEASQERIAIEA